MQGNVKKWQGTGIRDPGYRIQVSGIQPGILNLVSYILHPLSLVFKTPLMAFINYNKKKRLTIFPGVHSAMEHSDQITYGVVNLDEETIVPIHSHPHEQWTYILEGQMEFTLDGEKQLLLPGTGAYIPSNALHGAVAVTACKVIDVFTPVREDYQKLDPGYRMQDVG